MGSVPVLFSDVLKMPHGNLGLWSRCSETFDVSELFKLCDGREYDNSEYFENFSNEKLYKSVVNRLL